MRAITNDSNMGGMTPTGTKNITTNGTHDVTEYAEADVQVPNSNTETYTASSSSSALDMGATNNYRYVNTSALTKVSGTKSITANGNNQDVKTYEKVNVSVPASAVCSGTKSITSNGTHTVTGYKTASVSVPSTHDAVYVRSATSGVAYIKYKIGSGSEKAASLGSDWAQIY